MLIDIDDALLARHQELLMKDIHESRCGKPEQPSEDLRASRFEREGIRQQIMDITTAAYFKRGENENNT